MRINNLILDETRYSDKLNEFGKSFDMTDSIADYEKDKKIFTDANILKKYKQYGKGVGAKINFVLVAYAIGYENRKDLSPIIDKIKNEIANDDNSFTVIFMGNYSANYIPFTPWILFHRAFHAIECYSLTYEYTEVTEYMEIFSTIKENLGKDLLHIYKDYVDKRFHYDFAQLSFSKYYHVTGHMVEWFFKFKSVKTKMHSTDIMAELFAQFCTNRRVLFTRNLPNFLSNKEKINAIIVYEKYEKELTDFFLKLEKLLVGKIFIF